MPDVLIVGSGASGVAAALALADLGVRPTLLDVGITPLPDLPRVRENLYDHRARQDTFDLQIGGGFSGVRDILEGHTGIAKLNAPNMQYVTQDAGRLSPLDQSGFDAFQSFALGGLGNAWGAGLYRFVDHDLAGFPLRAADLNPYFDKLTREIGISGADDDLAPYFGDAGGLLPPLRLSRNAGLLQRRYAARRADLAARGIAIGHPRIGVLSQPFDGRPAADYNNLEFWQDAPYLYTPALTLRKLIGAGQLDYRPGVLVQRYEEVDGGVKVHAVDAGTGEPLTFTGEVLLLAAGAIGTTRIVLRSAGDTTTELRLLENPAVQIPFVLPDAIGRPLDRHAFGLVQLNLVWESAEIGGRLQGSIMELTSPMRAEFFGRFPLSARANLELVRDMLPAMLLMQLFYPEQGEPPARISLREDGKLRIAGRPDRVDLRLLGPLLGALRRLGLWTARMLISQPELGHAIHYAGTLPMRSQPGRYECDPSGRLSGAESVYIADSASFSSLPAKNMSLGMMANAMRIALLAVKDRPHR